MFPDETRDIPIWTGNSARVSVLRAVITDTSLSDDGVTRADRWLECRHLEMEIQQRAALAADGSMVRWSLEPNNLLPKRAYRKHRNSRRLAKQRRHCSLTRTQFTAWIPV
ncbi:MAG: hypothetical protein R3C26_06030 [Calditrichia bacterium]